MKKVFFLVLLLSACENGSKEEYFCTVDNPPDPMEIYVDPNCNDRITSLIWDSAAKINKFGGQHMCADLIEFVDYYEENMSSIICEDGFPEGDRLAYESTIKRNTGEEIIRISTVHLFDGVFEGANSDFVLSVIMHELTHAIGVNNHTHDSDALMYKRLNSVGHYTTADKDFICAQLDCIN